MRKYYLDNIRWATVLLVLVYHVGYLFNNVGVLGGIGTGKNVAAFNVLLYFVYPWFMVLLFVVAGISARYSLEKRSAKQFVGERVTKLLIPSTLGLLAYQWITGYFNVKIGGGLTYIPVFLRYPVFALSGIGPLWFIQMLFLFSVLIALVHKIDRKDGIWNFCGKANPAVLLLLAVLIWGAAQILNVPVLTMYRFGIYGAAFLLGYFVFSHDGVQDSVEKMHVPMLIAAVALGIFYVITYFGKNYTSDECLKSVLPNVYLWLAVLAILGCGKAWCNRSSEISRYMTKSSFGLYIIHYPILMTVCYVLYYDFNLPSAANYVVALLAEMILTFAVFELFQRIPFVRYWVLGIKGKQNHH
jgi:glucan biosynthesis protein C